DGGNLQDQRRRQGPPHHGDLQGTAFRRVRGTGGTDRVRPGHRSRGGRCGRAGAVRPLLEAYRGSLAESGQRVGESVPPYRLSRKGRVELRMTATSGAGGPSLCRMAWTWLASIEKNVP